MRLAEPDWHWGELWDCFRYGSVHMAWHWKPEFDFDYLWYDGPHWCCSFGFGTIWIEA